MSNYKIGDFERRGNAMRLFFVNKDCDDYWGDDWNDRPYEHNAGIIYDEYVPGILKEFEETYGDTNQGTLFTTYLSRWLEKKKQTVEATTYEGYRQKIANHVMQKLS